VKWFKHDSNASMDAKLKRVMIKYGMEGYGLYWYCLELIAQTVEKHNLTFELEHDAELIAASTQIHYERVQEMMADFVNWGLFEDRQGIIFCLKMATRTDEYTQQLMRTLTKGQKTPETLPINSEVKEEKRIEQNRKTLGQKNNFDLFWSVYPRKVKKREALDVWKRKKLDSKFQVLISDVENRLQKDDAWKNGFIPHPTTYLRGERWNDEIQKPVAREPEVNSKSQILRVGLQRGLKPRPGESMDDYTTRVRNTRHE